MPAELGCIHLNRLTFHHPPHALSHALVEPRFSRLVAGMSEEGIACHLPAQKCQRAPVERIHIIQNTLSQCSHNPSIIRPWLSLHPIVTWSRRSHSWQELTRKAWAGSPVGNREASGSTPEQNALGNQERTREMGSTERARSVCSCLPRCNALPRQSPLKQGASGEERNATGIASCVQFR